MLLVRHLPTFLISLRHRCNDSLDFPTTYLHLKLFGHGFAFFTLSHLSCTHNFKLALVNTWFLRSAIVFLVGLKSSLSNVTPGITFKVSLFDSSSVETSPIISFVCIISKFSLHQKLNPNPKTSFSVSEFGLAVLLYYRIHCSITDKAPQERHKAPQERQQYRMQISSTVIAPIKRQPVRHRNANNTVSNAVS
jgi:hypothetical protein